MGVGRLPWGGLVGVAVATLLLVGAPGAVAAQTIRSGNAALSFPAQGTARGIAIRLAGGSTSGAGASQPVALFICGRCADGEQPAMLQSGYATVTQGPGGIVARATLRSANGSVFRVEDRFYAGDRPGMFGLSRSVAVVSADPRDRGFNSRFAVRFTPDRPVADYGVLIPATWYDRDRNADGSLDPKSLAANPGSTGRYYRETRLPLPFVMMQDASGAALSIARGCARAGACAGDPPPSSGADEGSRAWLVNGSVQYASLGIDQAGGTDVGVIYPMTEAQAGPAANQTVYIRRSHPVATGTVHRYSLGFALAPTAAASGRADYAAAMRQSWRLWFDQFNPVAASVPPATVYGASIALLKAYSRNVDGAQGLPFKVGVLNGYIAPHGYTYNMGFVGEQLPLGYVLFRHGVLDHDAEALAKGKATLDFWANRSGTPSGMPLIWYDPRPGGRGSFRGTGPSDCKQPIFMRSITDGLEQMQAALVFSRGKGMPQPDWARYVGRAGEWLLRTQDPATGSFPRSFNADGSVIRASQQGCNPNAFGESTSATTQPIRFLTQMFAMTRDPRYRDAAIKAGSYALATQYRPIAFNGGTSDHPNVLDKEAGVIALHAAIALYDMTHDARWIEAARRAGDFVETWQYSWDFALKPASSTAMRFAGPRAFGVIAKGAEVVDVFLAIASYDFYRLHLLGGDADGHYLRFARLLEGNTKLSAQLPVPGQQRFGFVRDGLVGEATRFADFVGGSSDPNAASNQWLPWLTNAFVDPYVRMEDRFGVKSIERAVAGQRPGAG